MGATYALAVGFISNSLVKVICLYGKCLIIRSAIMVEYLCEKRD